MLATHTIDSASLAEVTTEAQNEEAEAVRRAFEGRWLPRARLALRSLHRLLQDPNDTKQVFVLTMAMSAKRLPELLTEFVASEEGLELLAGRPSIDSSSVDYDALRALPADTLGGAYVRFLDDNGLDPDLFQAPPGLPPGIAYVIQRMRQTHDLWHVVTGYDSDIPGELAILAFTYGQTRAPSVRLLAMVGTLRYSLELENIFGRVWRAYRRGEQAPFMGATPWEKMWHLPLNEVRERLQLS